VAIKEFYLTANAKQQSLDKQIKKKFFLAGCEL
jgi:hypothetical protein